MLPFPNPSRDPSPNGRLRADVSGTVAGLSSTQILHLVRDEGVAGSNPATPTSFLDMAITTGA